MANSISQTVQEDHNILGETLGLMKMAARLHPEYQKLITSWAQALHSPALSFTSPFKRLRIFAALISIERLTSRKVPDDKIQEASEAFDLQRPNPQAQTLQIMWFAVDEAVRSFKEKYDQLESIERETKAYVTDFVGKSSRLDLQCGYIAASATAIEKQDSKPLANFAKSSNTQDNVESKTGSEVGSQLEKLNKHRMELEDIKHSLLARACLIQIENEEIKRGKISLESLKLKAKSENAPSTSTSEARSENQKIIDALETTVSSLTAAQALNQNYMKQVIAKHSILRDEKSKWAKILNKVAYVHKSAELLQMGEFTNGPIEIFKHILCVINEAAVFQDQEGVTAELNQTLETFNVLNGWKSQESSDLKKLIPKIKALVHDVEAANVARGEIPKPLELEEVAWSGFVADIDRQVNTSKQDLEADAVN